MDLVVDDAFGDRDLDGGQQGLHHLVAGLHALAEPLAALGVLDEVGLELLQGVELARQLGELVVELGELALLDRLDGDGALGGCAGVVAARERGLERLGLARGHPDERLVHAFEHVAGADLVGHPGDGVDLLAVDLGRQVDRHEVARGGGALDALEGAETLAQRGEALFDVGVADLDRVDLDGQGGVVRQLDLGALVDLGGEGEALTGVERHLGDVDLRLTQRAHRVLLEGLPVEGRERVVDGLLQHGALAQALVDDPRRDLAAPEPRDLDLAADGLVRLLQAGLELLGGDLDGQLHPGRAEGLERTLHCGYSRSGGRYAVRLARARACTRRGGRRGRRRAIRSMLAACVRPGRIRERPTAWELARAAVTTHEVADEVVATAVPTTATATSWAPPRVAGPDGRGSRIRTDGLPLPKRTRYQTAPYPGRWAHGIPWPTHRARYGTRGRGGSREPGGRD